MLRISKTILWIAAVVAGAYILICVAANLWLQSPRVQERLRRVASEALDVPVTVGRIYYLPWSGVTLRKITTQADSPDAPRIVARSLRLRFQLLPLLQKELRIQEIRLDQPRISWKQSEDGSWKTFGHAPRTLEVIEAPTGSESIDKPSPVFEVNVLKGLIRNGEITLFLSDGREFVSIRRIELETLVEEEGIVSGNATVDSIQFSDRVSLQNLRSPFHLENGLLTMDGLRAKWAGGKISGFLELRVTKPDVPFKSKLKLVDIEINDLLSEAGFPSGGTEGALNGTAELRGALMDVNELQGTGLLDLHEGRMATFEFLRPIGSVMGIDELQDLTLRNAAMRYRIENERFFVEDLTVKSENLILKVNGKAHFDGKLKMKGRFIINEKIQRELRGLVNDNFKPSDDLPGHKEVDFEITGRTDSPRTNLLDKIIGHRIGDDFGGLLRSFLKMPGISNPSSPSPTTQPSPAP